MTIPARVSIVTLGVADVPRAKAFYQRLGFPLVVEDGDDFAAFRTAGALLALFGTSALAADAARADEPLPGSFRGVSLAINVGSPAEVDEALAEAERAGGTISKPAETVFWGGYSGYFADPDGHAWEVAHNPGWPLDERGLPTPPP